LFKVALLHFLSVFIDFTFIYMQWRNSFVEGEPGGDPEDAKPSVYYSPNVDLATIVAIVAIVASPRSWSRSAEMAIY
jgi:hypothetical protein